MSHIGAHFDSRLSVPTSPSRIPRMDPIGNYNLDIQNTSSVNNDGFEYKDDESRVNNPPGTETPIPSQVLINRPVTLSKNVSAFLVKLYNMVGDPSTDWLISWNAGGASFLVYDHQEFARKVLPMFFKHSNFASFVRQLNMYGFHKLPVVHQGMAFPRLQSEIWEFTHPKFRKNRPELLCCVHRKKSRDQPENIPTPPGMGRILDKIETLKNHQILISSEIKNLQADYKDLYTRSIEMRNIYRIQQEKIDKIIKFIASLYSYRCDQVAPSKRKRLLDQQDNTTAFTSSYSPAADNKNVSEVVKSGPSHHEDQKIQNLLSYISNVDNFNSGFVQDRNLVHASLQNNLIGAADSCNISPNNSQTLSLQSRSGVPDHLELADHFSDYRLPPDASFVPILKMLAEQKLLSQPQEDYHQAGTPGQRHSLNSIQKQPPIVNDSLKALSRNSDPVIDSMNTLPLKPLGTGTPSTHAGSSMSLVRIRPEDKQHDYRSLYVPTQAQIPPPLPRDSPHFNVFVPKTLQESKPPSDSQNVTTPVKLPSPTLNSATHISNHDAKNLPYVSTFPMGLGSVEGKLSNLCARSSAIENAEKSLNNEIEALSSMVGSECLDELENADELDDLCNFLNFDPLPELDGQTTSNSTNQDDTSSP